MVTRICMLLICLAISICTNAQHNGFETTFFDSGKPVFCEEDNFANFDSIITICQPFIKIISHKHVGYTKSKKKVLKLFNKNVENWPYYGVLVHRNVEENKIRSISIVPMGIDFPFVKYQEQSKIAFKRSLDSISSNKYSIYKIDYLLDNIKYSEYVLIDTKSKKVYHNFSFFSTSFRN